MNNAAVQAMGLSPQLRDHLIMSGLAMSGDIAFAATPATLTAASAATADGVQTRVVNVDVVDALGNVHTWFNKAISSGVAVADTSANNATIGSTTLTFVNGRAQVEIARLAATWASGETVTLTVAQATILGVTCSVVTSVETLADNP